MNKIKTEKERTREVPLGTKLFYQKFEYIKLVKN